MIGSSNTNQFKSSKYGGQRNWVYTDNPYLIRWAFIFFCYSMRIPHWIKSDDKRFYHDHSADLLSIVLKGKYDNVVPIAPNYDPNFNVNEAIMRDRIGKMREDFM